MGYNGPPPGDHWIGGQLVRTFIVRKAWRDEPLADIPQPGDVYPFDYRWVAGKPSRIEAIRPTVWSIDIPYVKQEWWTGVSNEARRPFTLRPRTPFYVVLLWALAIIAAVAWLMPGK
jgi:hypothetical protein